MLWCKYIFILTICHWDQSNRQREKEKDKDVSKADNDGSRIERVGLDRIETLSRMLFYICKDIYLQDIIELNKTDKEKSKMIKMLGKLIMMEAA